MSTSLNIETSTTYFRDAFVPFDKANVSIASSPFLYGLAIYTVFSANWNPDHKQLYIFRLREHYDRLVTSARIMNFADFGARYSFKQFQDVMVELLTRNHAQEDVLVRAMIFVDEVAAGARINGLKNELAVYVYPTGEILPLAGTHVTVSSWQRIADNMIPARAKINGSYVNTSLMKNDALAGGYDDAIALDGSGHVTEGTLANVFLVRSGTLITPVTSSDILEGITRNSVLAAADHLRIPAIERQVDRSELYACEEAIFVGSSARITPILSIDRRPVGTGSPGPVTGRLSTYYHELQYGLAERNWLTTVY
ncbi:MAG TPA: aminotransferase class IV [Candidatus Saccharimonadia bacterium]|nr:aminotransferase class IV [Candidatus Saccharimonadia bacterium]